MNPLPAPGRAHHKPAETDVTAAAAAPAPDDLDALFAVTEADLPGDLAATDFLS